MRKSTKATVALRVNEVIKLLIAGARFADMRRFATSQDWRVSDRQIHRYLKDAREQLAAATMHRRREKLGLHMARLEAIFARALKADNLELVRRILKDIADAQGIDAKSAPQPLDPEKAAKDERLRQFGFDDVPDEYREFVLRKLVDLEGALRRELFEHRPDIIDAERKRVMARQAEIEASDSPIE
jgi:hypothetical protein